MALTEGIVLAVLQLMLKLLFLLLSLQLTCSRYHDDVLYAASVVVEHCLNVAERFRP